MGGSAPVRKIRTWGRDGEPTVSAAAQKTVQKCRKGFHRKLVKGKRRCVRKHKKHPRHHKHRQR